MAERIRSRSESAAGPTRRSIAGAERRAFQASTCDFGVSGIEFERDEEAIGGQRASQPGGAVAAEGPYLEYPFGARDLRQQVEQAALVRRDVDGREPGRFGVGEVLGERRVGRGEEVLDVCVDALDQLFVERFHNYSGMAPSSRRRCSSSSE